MRATRRALQPRRCRNAACFPAAEPILRFSCVGTRLHPARQQEPLLQTFVSFLSLRTHRGNRRAALPGLNTSVSLSFGLRFDQEAAWSWSW